jgi:hypothetical protein
MNKKKRESLLVPISLGENYTKNSQWKGKNTDTALMVEK